MFVLYKIHWKRYNHDCSRGCNNLMLGHQCFSWALKTKNLISKGRLELHSLLFLYTFLRGVAIQEKTFLRQIQKLMLWWQPICNDESSQERCARRCQSYKHVSRQPGRKALHKILYRIWHCIATDAALQSDKKKNQRSIEGEGRGGKNNWSYWKTQTSTEEANKNIKQERNKRHYKILADSPRPPHLPVNSNAFFLSKMRRRKIRRSQRSRGESGKQKKTGKTKKQKTYSSALVELDFQFVEASENVDAKKSS